LYGNPATEETDNTFEAIASAALIFSLPLKHGVFLIVSPEVKRPNHSTNRFPK
jgi:hypothetical protein